MNKILKLILVVVVVLGAIVGAAFLPELFGGMKPEPPKLLTLSDHIKQIEKEWADLDDWNADLFKQQLTRTNLSALSSGNKSKLRDLSANTAVGIIKDKICDEWKKSNCNHNTVVMYHNAINAICKENKNSHSDQRVMTIRSVYSTYTNARKWATSALVPESKYNSYATWRMYSEYDSSVRGTINGIKGSSNYLNYLSNIALIRSGFNKVDERLATGKTKYYTKLAASIINRYSKIPSSERTGMLSDSLRKCRNRYDAEYRKNDDIHTLTKQFSLDAKNNASSASILE